MPYTPLPRGGPIELCVDVTLHGDKNPTLWEENIPAKIDTGSSATVIPLGLVDRLRLTEGALVEVTYANGVSEYKLQYFASLQIQGLDKFFEKIHVITRPNSSEILIGRNILNKLLLIADGPAKVFSIT